MKNLNIPTLATQGVSRLREQESTPVDAENHVEELRLQCNAQP